jgi:hypothetical protein
LAKPSENNKMCAYTLAKPSENNKMYAYIGAKSNENNPVHTCTGLFSFVLAFFQLRDVCFRVFMLGPERTLSTYLPILCFGRKLCPSY